MEKKYPAQILLARDGQEFDIRVDGILRRDYKVDNTSRGVVVSFDALTPQEQESIVVTYNEDDRSTVDVHVQPKSHA